MNAGLSFKTSTNSKYLNNTRIEFLVMAKIRWNIFSCFWNRFCFYYSIAKLNLQSLFYNDFADKYYVGDTAMEPMFWFVDHFTKILGPICVVGVILLASSVILIAYSIGLPFYLKQATLILIVALVIGHWLLVNVVFYYYMSYMTGPGYPPQGAMITEAVSICKKCIAPKPPRTHHCSVCNRCILKMDHHCPWLNNCIGHFNHRYFFMFCAYAWIGVIFVMSFGIPIAYEHFFGNTESLKHQHETAESQNIASKPHWTEALYHSCIVYAALLCIAVFFVLGGLLAWHSHLISKGETSIEGHINKKERKRLIKEGIVYKNIYDFGPRTNWKIFLGIHYHRPWWHILFPFVQEPYGDGLHWETQNDIELINETLKKKNNSKSCLVKLL